MRIVLVDGMNLAYRAYYTHGQLATSQGTKTGVIYAFLRMLNSIYVRFDSSPVLVFWEGGTLQLISHGETYKVTERTPLWRKSLPRQKYKSNRKITPHVIETNAQIPPIQKVLAYLRYPQFAIPGLEGDDLIGIAATKLHHVLDPEEIAIISSDRDFFQLVSDSKKIFVYRPGKGAFKKYNERLVEQEHGVLPKYFTYLKALTGDGSDNYDGIPGIGPKRAVDIIMAGGVPSLSWESQDDGFKKQFAALEKDWQKAKDCYKLALIPRHVGHKWFSEDLKDLVTKEFKDLDKRIKRKFTSDELSASIKLFASFCARYELESLLAYKRSYFAGVYCDGSKIKS